MATSILPQSELSSSSSIESIWKLYSQSLKDVIDQIAHGNTQPSVGFSNISAIGSTGIAMWKSHIEAATQTQFRIDVNLLENKVTLTPTSQHSTNTLKEQDMAEVNEQVNSPSSNSDENTAAKVPRPLNHFIMYRLDWHHKIAAANPHLRNNEISQVIGKQWAAESHSVKEEYKRRARDAKAKHAIAHPNYQYKPRKPSEKKKRMTKTKLAKLRAKAQESLTSGLFENFNDQLSQTSQGQAMMTSLPELPYPQLTNAIQTDVDSWQPALNLTLSESSGEDLEAILMDEIATWNSAHNQPGLDQSDGVSIVTPLVNGISPHGSLDIPTSLPSNYQSTSHIYNFNNSYMWNSSATTSQLPEFSITAAVDRQNDLVTDPLLFSLEDYA